MGNVIQIDDGSKVYDITNMRGELLGQFKFIPSDFDLIRRYDETVSAFEQMSEEIKGKKDAPISYVMELDKLICLMRRWRKASFRLPPRSRCWTAGSSLLKMC